MERKAATDSNALDVHPVKKQRLWNDHRKLFAKTEGLKSKMCFSDKYLVG